MPPAKTWYFQVESLAKDATTRIKVFTGEGNELKKGRGKKLGAIREISPGGDDAHELASATQRTTLVKVAFQDGTALLDIRLFSGKCSEFSKKFDGLITLEDFLEKWEEETKFCIISNVRTIRYVASKFNGAEREFLSPDNSDDGEEMETVTATTLLKSNNKMVITAGNKRAPSMDENQKPVVKKSTLVMHHLDEQIEKKKVGSTPLMINTNICHPPEPTRQLRKVDPYFIKSLKKRMIQDPAAPGVSPAALLCHKKFVEDSSDFKVSLRNQCQYEVLGGLHTVTAKKELMAEVPDNPFFSECIAYVYCGLTDEEALRLASRHNINGHYTHEMTHRDYVEACRCLLEMGTNGEIVQPTQQWRDKCRTCILPKSFSTTNIDNILKQASFNPMEYKMAIRVMEMFSEGETKGQKPPTNAKQLQKKIAFKQHYLEPIQNLSSTIQQSLLSQVLSGNMSIPELQEEGKRKRAMKNIKECFLRCVNMKEWNKAVEVYPNYASEDKLKVFFKVKMKTKEGLTQPFKDYCRAALDSVSRKDSENSVDMGGCAGYFISSPYTKSTKEALLSAMPSYQGSTFIIAGNCKQNDAMTESDIKTMVWSAKEFNTTSASLSNGQFSLVAICTTEKAQIFTDVFREHLLNAEILYLCHEGSRVQPLQNLLDDGKTMMPSVLAAVIGHWSQDGKLHPANFSDLPRRNFTSYKSSDEIWSTLLKMYTSQGQCILIFEESEDEGTIANTALKMGRNFILFGAKDDIRTEMQFSALASQVTEP